MLLCQFQREHISAVKNGFVIHFFCHQRKIRIFEFRPFCSNQKRISMIQCRIHIFGVSNFITKNLPHISFCNVVISNHLSTLFQQQADIIQRRCFADIIGIGFERQSPHCNLFTLKAASKILFHLRNQNHFLIFVDTLCRIQKLEFITFMTAAVQQSLNIFRETASAVTNAREKKTMPNPVIASHAQPYEIYIGPYFFTKVSNLVHECNLNSQEGVGSILR